MKMKTRDSRSSYRPHPTYETLYNVRKIIQFLYKITLSKLNSDHSRINILSCETISHLNLAENARFSGPARGKSMNSIVVIETNNSGKSLGFAMISQ